MCNSSNDLRDPLSVAELAYTAGLVDGEGCIRLANRRSAKGSTTYTVTVQVNSTDERMARFLGSRFGGAVRYVEVPRQPNRKPQWAWQASATIAVAVLEAIYPYLVIKKEQARLARVYQALTPARALSITYGGNAAHKRPQALVEVQGRLYGKFRALNRRGRIAA